MKIVKVTSSLRFFITLLVLASIGSTQAVYDYSATNYQNQVKLAATKLAEPALPSSTALEALSLGNRQALADLLWIDTIQYFGSGNPYATYPSLGALIQRITDLDPKFEEPYEFALITLPFMQQSNTAITLGLKAQKEIPNNGLLTYYLATIYHLNLKDYKNAAKYYKLASTQPGAPGAAITLAGTALNDVNNSANDRLVAAAFWESVYENAKDSSQKELAKDWYEQMEIVYSLEVAAQQYKTQFGNYPATLQDLVSTGYIAAIPASPVNRKLVISPLTGKIDFSQPADSSN